MVSMARRLVATGESERRLLWRGHALNDLSRRLEVRDLIFVIRRLVGTGISDMRLLWRRHARDDLLMRMLCVLGNGIWLTPNASLETALRRRGDGGGQIVACCTPEDVSEVAGSHTGEFLKPMLVKAGSIAAE